MIFRVDPPTAEIYLKETSSNHSLTLKGHSFEAFSLDATRATRYDFVVRAPGYVDHDCSIERLRVEAGKVNNWPDGGETLYLSPSSLAARVGQFWRRFTWLIVGSGLVFLALSGHFAMTRWKQMKNARRRARIATLGGNPDAMPMGPAYILLNRVGAGGFGEVYRAIHISELFASKPTFVAIKTILPHLLDSKNHIEKEVSPSKDLTPDEEKAVLKKKQEDEKKAKVQAKSFFDRFRVEATLLWELEHPNIVKLIDYEFNWDPPYIVMEFIDGESLDRILERYPNGMDPKQALSLIEKGLEAISFAHERAQTIVHRDLKPSNLMVRANGEMVVMDFGIANRTGDKRITAVDSNGIYDTTGSTQYMAFERLQSSELQHPASDQFALGAILFEMVTGRPALPDPTDLGPLFYNKLPKIMEVKPELGRFGEVIDRMRSHNYKDRFESVSAAHEALKQALS